MKIQNNTSSTLTQIFSRTSTATWACIPTCICSVLALGRCAIFFCVLPKSRRHLEKSCGRQSSCTARLDPERLKEPRPSRRGQALQREDYTRFVIRSRSKSKTTRGREVGDQAQSPMMTRGARSWRSSAAETGPVLGWLPLCLRLASLELDGGKRCMEELLAVMTSGASCSCCSSIPSCSASCRFMAMAWPAKKVRSRALPVLGNTR